MNRVRIVGVTAAIVGACLLAAPSHAGWRDTDTFYLVNVSPREGNRGGQERCVAQLEESFFSKAKRDNTRIFAISRDDALRRKPDALALLPVDWTADSIGKIVPETAQAAYLVACDPEGDRLDVVIARSTGIHGGPLHVLSYLRVRRQPVDARLLRWLAGPIRP